MKPRSTWFVYCCLLLGVFITLEAMGFQTPALPYITQHFGIATAFAGTISLFYYLSAIVFAPIMGRIGDQIGRKKMILFGLTIFTISEFIAAISPNFTIFLLCRFIQGVGYACIYPSAFAYISDLFPEEKRGRAIGIFVMIMLGGAASGGVIGGFLIDLFGWSIVYWVSGTLAAIGFFIVLFFVPKNAPGERQAIDYSGGVALFVMIGSLISIPIIVSTFGWSSFITIGVIVSTLIGFFALLFVEKRATNPIIDFEVLKIRGVHLPSILINLQTFCQISLIYALTFFVAGRPGWSALEVGIVSTANYVIAALASPILGRLMDKYKPKYFVVLGFLVCLIGAYLYTFIDMTTSFGYILFAISLVSFCTGACTSALMKFILSDTPKEKTGVGTGTFAMFKDSGVPLGTTFGLALFGTQRTSAVEDELLKNATEAGISSNLLPDVLQASNTKEIAPELANQLQALGIEINDIITKSTLDGTTIALQNVGFVILEH